MRHQPALDRGRSKLRRKPWFVQKPAALAEIRQVLSAYPDLRLIQTEDRVLIRGTFPVEFENAVLDRFQIEIFFPNKYPEEMPIVREVGGRIPWTLDSHVYPKSGFACLQVPDEWLLNPNQTFRNFVETSLRNYYLGQSLVAVGKEWPFGERAHGLEGLFESYSEILGENDPEKVTRYLMCLTSETIRGHWRCPCGSGRQVRHCCRQKLVELRERIPRHFAKSAVQRLRNAAEIAKTRLPGADLAR
jgi:hypothetical protein